MLKFIYFAKSPPYFCLQYIKTKVGFSDLLRIYELYYDADFSLVLLHLVSRLEIMYKL